MFRKLVSIEKKTHIVINKAKSKLLAQKPELDKCTANDAIYHACAEFVKNGNKKRR